jgi:hypothetical protein
MARGLEEDESGMGCVPAGLHVADLVGGDNPADGHSPPVVIRSNQRSCAVMQLQCRISQCIGNTTLREPKAYGTNTTVASRPRVSRTR